MSDSIKETTFNQTQTCSRSFAPKSQKRGDLLQKDNGGIVSQSLARASIYFLSTEYLTDFDNADETTPIKTDPERFQISGNKTFYCLTKRFILIPKLLVCMNHSHTNTCQCEAQV